ncbi:MAG: hypothetical protein IT580_18785 [Verrucomicrobiales bacterium]|nr:hypothetical protein [Verrucomicrobiales bacterium]
MESQASKPSPGRQNPKLLGFLFAWLEERVVCAKAIDLVIPTLRNRWLRPEVEAKLASLDLSLPLHVDLHRRVTLVMEMLEAIETGKYRTLDNWSEMEPWLHRAIAYFVKAGDAIPDHFEDGLEDDHREFVALGEKLGGMLEHFEAWQEIRRRRG